MHFSISRKRLLPISSPFAEKAASIGVEALSKYQCGREKYKQSEKEWIPEVPMRRLSAETVS